MITRDVHPAIETFRITCEAAPLQIEGTLLNGWHFYYRARGNIVQLGIGPDGDAAVVATLRPHAGTAALQVLPGRWEASLLGPEDEDGTAALTFCDLLDEVLGYPDRDLFEIRKHVPRPPWETR